MTNRWQRGILNPMDTTPQIHSLPEELLPSLISLASASAPDQEMPYLSESHWAQWMHGLKVWRAVLTETVAAHDGQQAAEPLPELYWAQAIECVPFARTSDNYKTRKGDWDFSTLPDRFRDEFQRWVQAGLLDTRPPHSSTEWPLVALARHFSGRLTADSWVTMVLLAFNKNAPSALQVFLDNAPAGAPTLASALQHRSKDAQQILHSLFTQDYMTCSAVLAPHLTRDFFNLKGEFGQAPLNVLGLDTKRNEQFLALGADPNALNSNGLFPEEVHLVSGYSYGADHKELHRLLGTYRTQEQQALVHSRFVLAAFCHSSLGTLTSEGLMAEFIKRPYAGDEKHPMGLFTYLLQNNQDHLRSKERLTLLLHLLQSKRHARRILEAEGSLEKGLQRAALVISQMDRELPARMRDFEKAFRPLLEELPDPRRFYIECLTSFPEKPKVGPVNFRNLCKLLAPVTDKIETKPTAEDLIALAPRLLAGLLIYTQPPRVTETDHRHWEHLLTWVGDVLNQPHFSPEAQTAWMPLLLPLCVLERRLVNHKNLATGGRLEKLWSEWNHQEWAAGLSAEDQGRVMKWTRQVDPAATDHLLAAQRHQRMEQQLPESPPHPTAPGAARARL